MWSKAKATGADLLWRLKTNAVLPVLERHDDGSFASKVYPGTTARRNDLEGIDVRIIEYTLDAPEPGAEPIRYRLATTICDPSAAPAAELAELYAQRWEIESAFDELKTHQRSPKLVLRSKMPDGVRQEVYGYLCVHYAIRWLMHAVATDAGTDPDRLSFTRTLRAARRTTASHPGFSPEAIADAHRNLATEVLFELLPARRNRRNARVVKRKMSNYQLKHPEHRQTSLALSCPDQRPDD